jgi:outer membrane protein
VVKAGIQPQAIGSGEQRARATGLVPPPWALALLCALTAPAEAETLGEALQLAARRSPALLAEQARSRAARAGVDVASAGYYPRVTASGDIGATTGSFGLGTFTSAPSSSFPDSSGARWGYSVGAELPLFDGWRTKSAVAEATAGAQGASAQVFVAEGFVLMEAVTAFSDVARDRQIEQLRSRNRQAAEEEVKAAVTRMQRGAATETDVAQARARHAQAIADLILAKSEARVGIAEYRRTIGHEPGELQPPEVPEAILPRSVEAAIRLAEASNQAVNAAELKAEASRHGIDRVTADGLPQVKLRAGVDGDNAWTTSADDRNGASVAVRVSVPLFDGGESAARVAQARELNISLAEDARGVRERVRAAVAAAWSRLVAGRDRLIAEREAVTANRRALDGVREEIKLGQRSTVEGLDAQRELVASEIRVVTTQRDIVVAAYSLLMATGQLTLTSASDGDLAKVTLQPNWQTRVVRVPTPSAAKP